MDYVLIYIGIGVVYGILINLIDQMEVEDHPSDTLDNMDHVMTIFLWPVLSFMVIKTVIKCFNSK